MEMLYTIYYDLTLREFYSIFPGDFDYYFGLEPNVFLI
jgi:hypothetical protein